MERVSGGAVLGMYALWDEENWMERIRGGGKLADHILRRSSVGRSGNCVNVEVVAVEEDSGWTSIEGLGFRRSSVR